MEDFPSLPNDFFDGLPNLDTGGIFGDPNQQKSPSANNTLGFNLTLPVEAKSLTIEGNTICGNQSNTSMTQGGIYGDPGFFNNAPVPSSSEACTCINYFILLLFLFVKFLLCSSNTFLLPYRLTLQ